MVEEERYAVVSCHVERPLDDRVWQSFSRLQERQPAGFRIAALMRPPDEGAGENARLWVERARKAAARGPLGHHTHWGGPSQARPQGGDPGARVRSEGAWLRQAGLEPTLFCGGGWYFDGDVAAAVAELGYADCTGTAFRPRYLGDTAPRLAATEPCWLDLPGGDRLLELPTTHSLGLLARALPRLVGPSRPFVHLYFHDTDLLDRARVAALRLCLAFLARHGRADLDAVAAGARRRELPVLSA